MSRDNTLRWALPSGFKLLLPTVAIRFDLRQFATPASFRSTFHNPGSDQEPGFGSFPLSRRECWRMVGSGNVDCRSSPFENATTSPGQHLMQSQTQKNPARALIVRPSLSRTLCAGIALWTAVNVAMAGNGPRMIEVSDDTQTYTGMIVAKSAQECFIFDRFGRQARLPIASLKSFSVVAESFRPASQSEFRRQLEAELGSEYEVATSKHYVVAGTHGHGRSYAALYEDIYNQVDSFYSLRGFRTTDPDAPLVALVLKDKAALKKYCEVDEMAWNEGLRGYYSLKSNRVVMYDLPELFEAVRLRK